MASEAKNFIDFISEASANTVMLNEFLSMCTVRELQEYLKKVGVDVIPSEDECKKILTAKNDLVDLINLPDSGVDKY